MFSIGDTVCYPMHGIGTIESIEVQDVLGKSAEYYVLRFVSSRMTAMIPVEGAERVGLRHVVPSGECENIIKYYKSTPPNNGSDNWNQRYRDNLDKLRLGDPYSVVDVVLCLNSRDCGKGLSSGERKMLQTAKSILMSELSVAYGKDVDEIELLLG
ncbi:MAG: CarD family transcriptional regulator [Christensenellaceae bacterium]|nr:CarD family transcriptional regulator [Christensenellaceae bacterium]